MSEQAGEQVFLRKSSGLVKSAGPFDVFVYNFGLISVGIAVTLAHLNVPGNYAGASIPLAEVAAAVFMACVAWGFWCWSAVIPRSGGVYAFVTRGLSPWLGFSVSFVDTFTWLFYNALAATYLTTIGIAPAMFAVGTITASDSLVRAAVMVQAPLGQLLIGIAGILVAGLVLARGMRAFFLAQKITLTIACLGTIACIAVLAGADHSSFLHLFSSATARYHVQPLQALAAPAGLGSPWSFSARATLLAAVWPVLSFVGGIFSINIGGEARNAKRTQLIGMFGSIAVAAAGMVLLSYLGDKVFGYDFQGGLAAFTASDQAHAFPLSPSFSLLAALATRNALLALCLCLGFMAWAFFWIPATIVYATRAMIAWSFDRLAPAELGFVHPVRHTPVTAIVVAVVANAIFLGLFLYTPFFGGLVLVLAAMLAWIPTMLGAILFPYRRVEMFKRSAMAGRRLVGLPTMTVAGALALIAVCVLTALLWNDPIAAGHSPQSIGTIAVVFAIGAFWYVAARAVRRRQGLRLERAFAEIPIE
jgi:amino acid transporter